MLVTWFFSLVLFNPILFAESAANIRKCIIISTHRVLVECLCVCFNCWLPWWYQNIRTLVEKLVQVSQRFRPESEAFVCVQRLNLTCTFFRTIWFELIWKIYSESDVTRMQLLAFVKRLMLKTVVVALIKLHVCVFELFVSEQHVFVSIAHVLVAVLYQSYVAVSLLNVTSAYYGACCTT